VLEPGAVEALDALGGEQVAIGDHAGDRAVAANARDDRVQVRVQQRLAAADVTMWFPVRPSGEAAGPHHLERHGLGMVVVFVCSRRTRDCSGAMGMTCAMMGWSVEASPLAIIRISRTRRCRRFQTLPRMLD